jgi:hypothetical protein
MNANSPAQFANSPSSVLLTMHERLASQSATCKLVGLVLAALGLAFVSGKSSYYLFLPLAPLLSAFLMDAAYAAQASRVLQLMRRLACGESKTAVSPWEMIGTLMAPQGLHAALPSLGGVLLFSVWPFYLTLGLSIAFIGAEVLAPKPLPVLPRNPVISGDHLAGPNIGKYPANGPQVPNQFQGVKPPQTLRPPPQVISGSNQPPPGGPKGGPVFSARPSQPVNPTQKVTVPPIPKTTVVPVLAAPTTSSASPVTKSSVESAPSAPTPAPPVAAPKVTSQPSPPRAAASTASKPTATTSNEGAKQQ